MKPPERMKIAVVGSGISGLSCAWLLGQAHDVTLYEAEPRLGGHSRTVDAYGPDGPFPVDMGFIVYNADNYPNLVALFDHLGVETEASDMSFGVSMDGGRLEYAGTDLNTLFAQRSNLLRPRFWAMIRDLVRFYRAAKSYDLSLVDDGQTLSHFLDAGGYGRAFREDCLMPQAAAIWSASVEEIGEYPARAFIRFFQNHGLFNLAKRPRWRTVKGGSRAYVRKLAAAIADHVRLGCAVGSIRRTAGGVWVRDVQGQSEYFDQVVLACHANQALRLLDDPSPQEDALLGAFRYSRNRVVMHTDPWLMPKRRHAWSAWNYLGGTDQNGRRALCVTYWMNRLQNLPKGGDVFVTLNPIQPIPAYNVIHTQDFEHPLFDVAALRAQRRLWSLQGGKRTWFCGAYFGSGFHEDGLQAGLAVAEALGGVRRPWRVSSESGRIHIGEATTSSELEPAR